MFIIKSAAVGRPAFQISLSLAIAGVLFLHCGSASNDENIAAAVALGLLQPACPTNGTCYEFNDSSGLNVGSGLTVAGGVVSGTGNFAMTTASAFTETRYQVTFTLPSGATFKLHYGSPAGGVSSSQFDAQTESNTFFVKQASASQAIDKLGTTDTMLSSMTATAATASTFCFETHDDGASSPLHMVAWSNCISTGSSTSAYNSEDSTKIQSGTTPIATAGNGPVTGRFIGFALANATIDRVVVMKKP